MAKIATTASRNLLRNADSNLECRDATGALVWSLPIQSIALIAEYTTDEGPYADDYFLVFVTVEDQTFYFSTCSFYSDGRDEVLSVLQEHLGPPMELELIGSTEWRSRVVWPAKMAGTEYFTFTLVAADTLTKKLKQKLLGPVYDYAISERVREYLREQLPK